METIPFRVTSDKAQLKNIWRKGKNFFFNRCHSAFQKKWKTCVTLQSENVPTTLKFVCQEKFVKKKTFTFCSQELYILFMDFLESIHKIVAFTRPNYLFQTKSKTKTSIRQEQTICFGNSVNLSCLNIFAYFFPEAQSGEWPKKLDHRHGYVPRARTALRENSIFYRNKIIG